MTWIMKKTFNFSLRYLSTLLNHSDFTLQEILEWISKNPDIIDINKHKTVKFNSNQLDVFENIEL